MKTLNLSGELISDEWAEVYSWFGYEAGYFYPGMIRDAVASLEAGEELVLEINSVGGDVDAAGEIYSVLAKCGNPTRAEIQSLAASAASYCILACDRVEISLAAQMMIHCASCAGRGNAEDHRWMAGMLETTDETILNVYCARCGEDKREELKELMEAETFLSANKALELGLVDAIIGQTEENQAERLVASVTNNILRAMRTLPDIRELADKRAKQKDDLLAEITAAKQRYHI